MKKNLVLMLLALSISCLVGCGKESDTAPTGPKSTMNVNDIDENGQINDTGEVTNSTDDENVAAGEEIELPDDYVPIEEDPNVLSFVVTKDNIHIVSVDSKIAKIDEFNAVKITDSIEKSIEEAKDDDELYFVTAVDGIYSSVMYEDGGEQTYLSLLPADEVIVEADEEGYFFKAKKKDLVYFDSTSVYSIIDDKYAIEYVNDVDIDVLNNIATVGEPSYKFYYIPFEDTENNHIELDGKDYLRASNVGFEAVFE